MLPLGEPGEDLEALSTAEGDEGATFSLASRLFLDACLESVSDICCWALLCCPVVGVPTIGDMVEAGERLDSVSVVLYVLQVSSSMGLLLGSSSAPSPPTPTPTPTPMRWCSRRRCWGREGRACCCCCCCCCCCWG